MVPVRQSGVAGPVPAGAPGHALALGRDMRGRLARAVRGLLDAPGLQEAGDAVRLAAVVLASRTPADSTPGAVVIRARELGRWLGLSESYVASVVLPGLRASGVVRTRPHAGEFGEHDGVECVVMPLWRARGASGDALGLGRTELATLLRLVEAVCAPGWRHRDGSVTRAGLLGPDRRGRGAATDRLALLLLVLEASSRGRVRRCGGRVDPRRGRLATTVARLMGCSPAAGERVLERLEEAGVVERRRKRTGTGLRQESYLVVPAVSAAHRAGSVGSLRSAGFVSPDGAAGDSETALGLHQSQVRAVSAPLGAEGFDPDVAGPLHTDHARGAEDRRETSGGGGCSGARAVGAGDHRPQHAGTREEDPVHQTVGGVRAEEGEGGPLRGEKQNRVAGVKGTAVTGAGRVPRPALDGLGSRRQRRGSGDVVDLRVRVAVTPVSWLWTQLTRGQQGVARRAVRRELAVLEGIVGPEPAPHLLANRLTDRLTETGGEALVREPLGWLLDQGLVQRPECSDGRCDDGIRMDTGTDCANCANILHVKRAWRARAAAEVDARLPRATPQQRKAAIEERLRRQAALEAEDFVWRRNQAQVEQARRQVAHAAAEVRAVHDRAAAAAAEQARQAMPCEDCGRERSAAQCEACAYHRQIEQLTTDAALTAATWTADLTDPADIATVTARVRQDLTHAADHARQQLLGLMDHERDCDPHATETALAYSALEAIRQRVPEYRRCALAMLARTPQADAEAHRIYATERSRHRRNPDGPIAVAAAEQAAVAARARTAEQLLASRLEDLGGGQRHTTDTPVPAAPAPWAERLAVLAHRPTEDDLYAAACADPADRTPAVALGRTDR